MLQVLVWLVQSPTARYLLLDIGRLRLRGLRRDRTGWVGWSGWVGIGGHGHVVCRVEVVVVVWRWLGVGVRLVVVKARLCGGGHCCMVEGVKSRV